jgi:hypothetical protein
MNLAIKAEERHHLIRRDLSKIAAHFHDSEKREYVKELLTNELKYITPSLWLFSSIIKQAVQRLQHHIHNRLR